MTSISPTLTNSDCSASLSVETTDGPMPKQERDMLYRSLDHFVGGLLKNSIDLNFARQELDYVYIREVLKTNGGNIGRAAKMLGMHRNTLSKRIKELNIPVKP